MHLKISKSLVTFFLILSLLFVNCQPAFAAIDFSSPTDIEIWPNPQFSGPSGVAVDSSGNVFVVDKESYRVMKYDGSTWTQIGSSSDFAMPIAIAIDSSDGVYVTDWDSSIKKYNGSGWDIYAGSDAINCSGYSGITFSPSGVLYLVCGNTPKIMYYDTSWHLFSGSDTTLASPISVAVDSHSNLYVTDRIDNTFNYLIRKYDPENDWTILLNDDTVGQTMGIIIGQNGNLFVNDRDGKVVEVNPSTGSIVNRFGEFGSDVGQFNQPWGIALGPNGKTYIADEMNDRIQFADLSLATPVWSVFGGKSEIGQFNSPIAMDSDSSGNIYVADRNNRRIQKYNGSTWTQFGNEDLVGPNNVVIGPNDYIYVADNNCIKIFNPQGVYQTDQDICTEGTFNSIAFDSQGTPYYILDSTNIVTIEDGAGYTYGDANLANFSNLANLVFDSNDVLYVTDSDLGKVYKYNPTDPEPAWRSVPDIENALSSPYDIAIDDENNLYITDQGNSKILKYNGSTWAEFGESGNGAGKFDEPTGIALNSWNGTFNIFVSDPENHNVQELIYGTPSISTPTPTATPQNNNSSLSPSGWSASTCSDSAPVLTPDLFQINTTSKSAKLFFTPIDYNQFYISFSTKPDAEMYGEQVTLLREGVQSHTIYHLKPNTTYYVKIRGQNGCMPGEWSNTMKFKTNSQIFYKNFSPSANLSSNLITKISSKNTSSPIVTPAPESSSTINESPKPTDSPKPTSKPNQSIESSKKCFLWWCW